MDNISTTSIPYFASYTDFHRRSGQAAKRHDDIPQFEASYEGVQNGFRYCFRKLGTDLTEYYALCETLDLLFIDTLGGRSHQRYQPEPQVWQRTVRVGLQEICVREGQQDDSESSSLRSLYLILTVELEDKTKTS